MSIEMGEDEMDKKIRAGIFQPGQVINPQPGYTYRLLNKNNHNIERRIWKGWEIVKEGPERLNLDDKTPIKAGQPTDGTRGYSDVILARMPTKLYDKWKEENRRLVDRTKGVITGEHEAARMQGSTFHGSEKAGGGGWGGSMDQKEFDKMQEAAEKKAKG